MAVKCGQSSQKCEQSETMLKIVSIILFLLLNRIVFNEAVESQSVLEKIKNGLQFAKNYLDTAKEIADLVSKSLGQNKEKDRKVENVNDRFNKPQRLYSGNLVSAFFRLLGLDSTRIAAIAVNSAIFLAQVISSLFNIQSKAGNVTSSRDYENKFDPFQFFINSKNEKIQYLVKQAQSPELPKQLINQLDTLDSECIRLLICKASPVIRAAQVSLNTETVKKFALTSWLPKREQFENNSAHCEETHKDCNLFPEEMDTRGW